MPADAVLHTQERLSPTRHPRPRRVMLALLLAALAVAPGDLGALTRGLMADAWFAVSVFVAATLLLFYGSERLWKFDFGTVMSKARMWQVPAAALLGATPGCGGAVVVVAAYASGKVGFGAVVATLTATMGDAAFLLLATRPDAAVVLLPISFAVGVLSGWLIDWLGYAPSAGSGKGIGLQAPILGRVHWTHIGFVAMAVPGLVVGVLDLTAPSLLEGLIPDSLLEGAAMLAIALMLLIWSTSPVGTMTNPADAPVTRAAEETAFISIWVIGAFLIYDYAVAYGGLDLEGLFASVAVLMPLMGVLVGLLPGCGPQILVTTLYINGTVPFAALIGNAISNDGDALFPALAVSPRAALVATWVSAIPALLVAYGFFFLAPGFLN